MIKIVQGSIFEANVEALVNPVNCVGVAGRGLAAEFKRRWPEAFENYRKACVSKVVKVGSVYTVFLYPASAKDHQFMICFPTKWHWRLSSRIEWIEQGLDRLRLCIENLGIRSIAIPALGCGLGGLDWEDVRPLIVGALEGLDDVESLIYEPML